MEILTCLHQTSKFSLMKFAKILTGPTFQARVVRGRCLGGGPDLWAKGQKGARGGGHVNDLGKDFLSI